MWKKNVCYLLSHSFFFLLQAYIDNRIQVKRKVSPSFLKVMQILSSHDKFLLTGNLLVLVWRFFFGTPLAWCSCFSFLFFDFSSFSDYISSIEMSIISCQRWLSHLFTRGDNRSYLVEFLLSGDVILTKNSLFEHNLSNKRVMATRPWHDPFIKWVTWHDPLNPFIKQIVFGYNPFTILFTVNP